MKPITEERQQALIERLKKIASWDETYGPDHNVILPASEAKEMAEVYIASLTAEAKAYSDLEELSFPYATSDMWPDPLGFGRDIALYTAPPVPVIKFPDEHSFDAWFKAIEAGDDQGWSEPEYLSKEWHEYLGRRQLALGAYRLSIDETKRLNGMVQ